MIWHPHVLKLLLCVHRPHQFPGTSWAPRFNSVFLFPRVCILCVFLSPHLWIIDWISACVPHQFPDAKITALFFFRLSLDSRDWQVLRRLLPRTQRVVQHQIHGSRLRHRQIHWLWFCHRLTFTGSSFLSSLDMALCFLIGSERKLLKWLQENIEKFMMLNIRRRWFHSTREKNFLWLTASWFLVSTYLIWILGSKFILSNNQSRATLWVLDTGLIVGLRPLMIILITASLSSKMYNWDSPWEECVFVGT